MWRERGLKMNRIFHLVSLGVVGLLFLSGCGGSSLGDSVHVFIDPVEGLAGLDVEMSDGMQVNLDGEFNIGGDGYGTISFVQPTRRENGRIRITVDLSKMAADQIGYLEPVRELPNGAPLPAAVLPPLFKVPVINSGSVTVDAALSVIPELQLGAIIHVSQMNSNRFPNGVAICQNFRNKDRMAYAAVCLFGPGNGKSGGIFVAGTLGEVFDLDQYIPQQEVQQSDLMARSADTRLMASAIIQSPKTQEVLAQQRVLVEEREEATSWDWKEQRYDPRNRLSGSRGQSALNNARNILKRR